jgi:general secretion pathway protein D
MSNKLNPKFHAAAFAVTLLAICMPVTVRSQTITAAPTTVILTPVYLQLETGPVLDVVPYVLSDGYTINMALIPSLVQFSGYDAPPTISGIVASGNNANVVQASLVSPHFTVRQVVTTVNVWDNQTVVLGGLITSQVTTTKDKVPMIGDIPLLGRLFQSQTKNAVKKNLMIFATATIVDPAGNRVHSDDDLPFAQTATPPQPEGYGKVMEKGSQPVSVDSLKVNP